MYIRRQDAIDSIEDSIGLIGRALCDMDIPLCDERKMIERERKSLLSLRDDIKEIPAADVIPRDHIDGKYPVTVQNNRITVQNYEK